MRKSASTPVALEARLIAVLSPHVDAAFYAIPYQLA